MRKLEKTWLKLFIFSRNCPLTLIITMVRSITVFVCALVANADYICTTTPASNDCQCLTIVEDMSGQRDRLELYVFAPGAAAYNPDDCSGCDVVIGQSNFTTKTGGPGGGGIAYTPSSGEDLCVSGVKEQSVDMVPCDYKAQGGIFVRLSSTRDNDGDGQLLHIAPAQLLKGDECLEPGLFQFPHDVSIGNCSSSWTISPTPSCGAESEMVIA